jgi:hypothetical protein
MLPDSISKGGVSAIMLLWTLKKNGNGWRKLDGKDPCLKGRVKMSHQYSEPLRISYFAIRIHLR